MVLDTNCDYNDYVTIKTTYQILYVIIATTIFYEIPNFQHRISVNQGGISYENRGAITTTATTS